MATRPSRLERITNLLLSLLNTTRPLSLREIGSTVSGYPSEPGALRQAFERDKRTLRDEGIPITAERIDGDEQVGYRILPEQYYLPDLQLSPDEQEALAFALAAVRLEGGTHTEIGAKLGAGQAPDLAPVIVLPSLPQLGILQEAVRARSIAQFDYRGRARAVAGYRLVFRGGSWYFIGQVDDGEGVNSLRTFRVDRIESEPELGPPNSYELPSDFDALDTFRFASFVPGLESLDSNSPNGPTEVTIDVDVREARRAIAVAGEKSRIDGAPHGSVRLRFHVGDEQAFVLWVLGFGDAVELMSPSTLRQIVIEKLQEALVVDRERKSS